MRVRALFIQSPPNQAFHHLCSQLWHEHLGHPRAPIVESHGLINLLNVLQFIILKFVTHVLLASILNLSFVSSFSRNFIPFDIIHYDIWTSPV